MKRWAGLALIAVLAVAGLAACGTKKLKDTEVASQVKSQVLQDRGIQGASVKCPKETEAKKGAKIKCTVRREAERGTVTATVLDEDGKLGRFDTDLKDVQVAVIEENAAEQGRSEGISGDVDCGEGTEPKKGAIYFCTAKVRGSGTGVVLVTQKDEASNVDVRVRKRRLTTAKIERQIAAAYKKQVDITVNVDCPGNVTSQVGSTFSCKVTNPANGRSQTVVATQKDEEGNFSLKVK